MASHPAAAHIGTMADKHITEPFLVKLKAVIDADPNLTAAGLSVKAGLGNSAIRSWLAGTNQSPRIESARKICEALGTTLEEFLADAQTEEEKQIVRLVSQLPDDLRRQLIGYGEALAATASKAPAKPDEDGQ